MRNFIEKIDNDNGEAGVVVADEYNSVFSELKNAVSVFFGLSESDNKQLVKSINAFSKAIHYEDTGVSNKLVLSRAGISNDIDTLFDGMCFMFSPKYQNTSSATIKISQTPTRIIVDASGNEFSGGELVAGELYIAIYRGDKFFVNKLSSIKEEDISLKDTAVTSEPKFNGAVSVTQDVINKQLTTIKNFIPMGSNGVDDYNGLLSASKALGVVDLLGGEYVASSIPEGDFVNGIVKVAGEKNYFGLVHTKKKGNVRLGTWNIWGSGSSNANFGGDRFSPSRLAMLKKDLVKMGLDIVGLQEVYAQPASLPVDRYGLGTMPNARMSVSMIFDSSENYGNVNLSRFAVESSQAVVFASQPSESDSEYRSYIKTSHTVNGKSVSVYNTHFSLDTPRIQQMATELCDAVLSDSAQAIFVMGDFNTNDWSLFQRLINAGFSQLNNDTIDTNPSSSRSWYIDDVFFKGAQLVGEPMTMVNTVIADHTGLYADFNI